MYDNLVNEENPVNNNVKIFINIMIQFLELYESEEDEQMTIKNKKHNNFKSKNKGARK